MSDTDSKDDFDMSGLDSIIKALKVNKMTVRVGILGGKDARDDGQSNASIGAAHEFGTTKIPRRSFLRMPLANELPKELDKLGLFTQKDIDKVIKNESLKEFAEKIGSAAVNIVLQAFDSGGFGTWDELKPYTIKERAKLNQGTQILVATHQLRDSIDFDVKKATS